MPWDDSGDPVSGTVDEQTNRYHRLARELLNSWTGPTCAVDCDGSIVAVDQGRIDVAELNGGTAQSCGIGVDYLDTCERAAAHAVGLDAEDASVVAQGLAQVLAGTLDRFSHDYPCHSPGQDQWFSVRLTPALINDAVGAVITHVDITDLHELQKSRASPVAAQSDRRPSRPGTDARPSRTGRQHQRPARRRSCRHRCGTARLPDISDHLDRGADAVLVPDR